MTEFYKVLPRALRFFLGKADDNDRSSVNKVIKVWEERRVFGATGTKTLHQVIEEAEVPSSTPKTAHQSEEGLSHRLPAPVDVPALAEAVRSAELAGSQAALLAPAAQDHATVGLLESYRAALASEVKLREVAWHRLEAAVSAQKTAHSHAVSTLQSCEEALAAAKDATERVPAAAEASLPEASLPDQNGETAASKMETNEPPSVDAQQAVSAPTADDALHQPHVSEAASLAAKLLSNPQALLDAIAATVPQPPVVPGGQDHSEEEYDPENPF